MPDSRDMCFGCFEDKNIKDRIAEYGGDPGCDVCDEADAPTMSLSDVCEILVAGIQTKFSRSVDTLFHDDEAKLGFAGSTLSTDEALFDELALELGRDSSGILKEP